MESDENKNPDEDDVDEEVLEDEEPTEDEEDEDEEEDEEDEDEDDQDDEDEDDPDEDEEEEEEEDSSDVAALKLQIAELKGMITTLVKPQDDSSDDPPKEDLKPADLSEVFKDVDFDAAVDTKEGFMELMGKVVAVVQKQTTDQIMGSLPNAINTTVEHKTSMQKIHDDFYEANPELVGIKKYVGEVANGISTENPEWTVDKVLEESAKQVKTSLGIADLKKPSGGSPDGKKKSGKKKPALPGSKTTRKKTVKKSSLQSEIDEIL